MDWFDLLAVQGTLKSLLLRRLKAGGEGDDRGWDGWMASLTRWPWVLASSGNWWWTGKPGVLQFMGLQRVGHDWGTELNWYATYKRLTSDLKTHTDWGWRGEKSIPCKYKWKNVWVAILISCKKDFETETIASDTEMVKGLTQKEDIMLANIYASNIGAPKYIKQIDTMGEIDISIIW